MAKSRQDRVTTAGQSGSRGLTAAEQANVDTVNGFCDAQATRGTAHIMENPN